MPEFSELERHIQRLFLPNTSFNYNGHDLKVLTCGKPTCPAGEPKTDLFILLQRTSNEEVLVLKISVKKDNADFLENKTSAKRAEAILGENWASIIKQSTSTLHSEFKSRPLIYKNSYKRTNTGSITLGWKFEILNKKSGDLSAEIKLSRSQKIDIFSGSTLPLDKRDAYVNGCLVKGSGIADYLLSNVNISALSCPQDVLNSLVDIEQYIDECNPKLYFACKALNYRTFEKKYDGDRPLAVYVDWNAVNGKLTPTIVYDNPLITKGNSVYYQLIKAMSTLNISDTDDINLTNISSLNYII